MSDTVDILGVPFDNITKEGLMTRLSGYLEEEKNSFVVTANPEIVMYAKKNPLYKTQIEHADHIIADGIGVIMASRLLKKPLPERIPGYELMVELLQLANTKKLKVYFLGATQEVIEALEVNVRKNYPDLLISGLHNGYFNGQEEKINEEIEAADADLVFVALGYPKQEEWIDTNRNQFEKGLFIGVGGSFDVIAGKVNRAPVFWQKVNLEWFYRLVKQPSRWKRMLAIPQFLVEVFKAKR